MDQFDTPDKDMNGADDKQTPSFSKLIRVGKEKPQAPAGKHLARCVHVEPAWTFLGNRKIALYFEVCEGSHTGTTARRFHNLKKLHNGEYEIAPKSKFLKDVGKLFPDKIGMDDIDPVELFLDKFFNITVEKRLSKDGNFNSIVTVIDKYHPGF